MQEMYGPSTKTDGLYESSLAYAIQPKWGNPFPTLSGILGTDPVCLAVAGRQDKVNTVRQSKYAFISSRWEDLTLQRPGRAGRITESYPESTNPYGQITLGSQLGRGEKKFGRGE